MKDLLTQKELRKEYRISHSKLIQFEEEGLKRYQEDKKTVLYSRKEFEEFRKERLERNDKTLHYKISN